MRSDHVDYASIVRAMSFGFPFLCERVMKQRDASELPGDRIADVLYHDLVRDPIATVRGLYASWGTALEGAAETRMRAFLDDRRHGARGGHEYAFESTGLDRDGERQKYAAYLARYGIGRGLKPWRRRSGYEIVLGVRPSGAGVAARRWRPKPAVGSEARRWSSRGEGASAQRRQRAWMDPALPGRRERHGGRGDRGRRRSARADRRRHLHLDRQRLRELAVLAPEGD
jgi:hypothetical protein